MNILNGNNQSAFKKWKFISGIRRAESNKIISDNFVRKISGMEIFLNNFILTKVAEKLIVIQFKAVHQLNCIIKGRKINSWENYNII